MGFLSVSGCQCDNAVLSFFFFFSVHLIRICDWLCNAAYQSGDYILTKGVVIILKFLSRVTNT